MTKTATSVSRFQSWRFLVFYAVIAGIFGFYLFRLF